MGGLLGLASGAGFLDYKGAPVDLFAGLASIAGGVAFAHSEFGTTLRTCGHTAVGISTFRKVEGWLGVRKQTITVTGESDMGDDYGADHIMEAARSL